MSGEKILDLEFEARPDGMYLCAGRAGGAPPPSDEIRKALDARGVMNYDLPKIEDVLARRRGAPERVGEPFRIFNREKEKYIRVTSTLLEARVLLASGASAAGVGITTEDILFRLRQEGVIHGVDRKVLDGLTLKAEFDREVAAARATPPVRGADARIVELVKFGVSLRPRVDMTGKADFRETENVHQVMAGDVLAEKIPPQPGKEGLSVFGAPLSAEPGADVPLRGGENTGVSPDGLKLVAQKPGFVFRGAQGISVGELFLVPGDVDFSVGNINYAGDILIQKSVLPGFEIKASGNVSVRGEVEAAVLVSKEKSVFVAGGVIGKGKCSVTAALDVEVTHVQNAELSAGRKVRVAKHALHSSVTAGESVDIAEVVGGVITSFGSLTVTKSGNESGVTTELVLVDRDVEKNKKKLARITELIAGLEQKIRFQETSLKNNNQRLAGLGRERLGPKFMEQLKALLADFQAHRKKRDFLQGQKQSLEGLIFGRDSFSGKVTVRETCFPGTVVRILSKEYRVRSPLSGKSFALSGGEIEILDG